MTLDEYLSSIDKIKELVPADKLADFQKEAASVIEGYKFVNQEKGKALTDLNEERQKASSQTEAALKYQQLMNTLKKQGIEGKTADDIAKGLNISASEKEELLILKKQTSEFEKKQKELEQQLNRYKNEEVLKPKFDEVKKQFKVNDKIVEVKDRFIEKYKSELFEVDPSNETVYTERWNQVLNKAYTEQAELAKEFGADPTSFTVPTGDANRGHFQGKGIVDRNEYIGQVVQAGGTPEAATQAMTAFLAAGGDLNK